jgi:cytochrome c553
MKALGLFAARAGICVLAVAQFVSLQSQAAAAGDIKAGQEIASQKCEVCHGLDGLSKIAEAPNLAGQVEPYLIKQLTAFKAGERQNEMMSVVAPGLSDKDIENLAAYYAAIEVQVVKVPSK